jgi:hypothetical protein
MRKLLVVLCAGLFVFAGDAQAYAGNGQGKAKKECEAACKAEYKACKVEAGNNRNAISKCDARLHFCLRKC